MSLVQVLLLLVVLAVAGFVVYRKFKAPLQADLVKVESFAKSATQTVVADAKKVSAKVDADAAASVASVKGLVDKLK
jgi:hypothetical protein